MKLHNSGDAAAVLSQFALDVAGQPTPADMISRVVQLAAKLVHCAAVDLIRVTGGGALQIRASSEPGLSDLSEKLWRRWPPHRTVPQHLEGVDASTMLPPGDYLRQLSLDAGVREQLMAPLMAGRTDHGYLRFMFVEPPAPADRVFITALGAHAAIALDRAALLTQVASLKLGLDSNRDVGAAVGILMTRHRLTYSEGLLRLKIASQHTNRKVRDIAADVLYTGELPE